MSRKDWVIEAFGLTFVGLLWGGALFSESLRTFLLAIIGSGIVLGVLCHRAMKH
jgi:hypothetical protein